MSAQDVYATRCMFHGPTFQGLVELTGHSPASASARLRALPPKGALLDTAGQLIGAWVELTLAEREILFPIGIERLEFHGPQPPAGADCAATIEVTACDEVDVIADGQISCGDDVWVSFTGWASRRFYGDADYRPGYRFPERNLLGTRRPEGWTLVEHRWSDIASRDLYMMKYLGLPEREAYEAIGPNRRRSWVLGRFAAKDAVRDLLWRSGAGEVFPAEIEIVNDTAGRPFATGRHGLALPPIQLSIAHSGELAVAAARPAEHGDGGIGIDIEEVSERDASVVEIACSPEEQAVLAALIAETGESPALWFTRFWAAKEAVAKAKGTGLEGRPQRFRVLGGTPHELRLEVPSRTSAGHAAGYAVSLATVENPHALPPRQYVVAWTGLGDPVAQPEGQDNR